MKQFLLGMLTASFCFGVLLYAQKAGMIDWFSPAPPKDAEVETKDSEARLLSSEISNEKKGRKRHHKRPGRPSASGDPMPAQNYDMSEDMVGDSLEVGSRELTMGKGGEEQLSEREIDQGIDRVFSGIERCLLLLPPDAKAVGKVIFGMNIAAGGQVTKVNLKGPAAMIKGETGACFTRAIKSIRFRSFNGPDMVVHYPVVFD